MSPSLQRDFLLSMTPKLRAYLRVLIGTRAEAELDAEDVLQDVFMQYVTHGPKPATPQAMRWLFVASRNAAFNAQRAARRRTRREGTRAVPLDAEATDDPRQRLEASETRAALQRCLDRIAAKHREMVFLKVVEQWSYARIAETMALPKSTVAHQVQSALVALNRCMHGGGNVA